MQILLLSIVFSMAEAIHIGLPCGKCSLGADEGDPGLCHFPGDPFPVVCNFDADCAVANARCVRDPRPGNAGSHIAQCSYV
ncbi:unnamed protein product [Zymoseptoria tritici ST99CH_1A5]|uniref:Extracellular membrane protein CFEM domain-containing protein n=1 Tax=Zymoseptoria tritici ST99CH_1A5 TaxID=1276529 RepID=A0A1Y6LLV9_ZYMTR|nr:unnamed protein product [Zymoseptoria tritici ST99CH_1A5]